ncbi:HNH endonuclease signature motif containing protein [Actinomadura chokoriensis]|uniref:HNH endonuclease signature motif containing protein n=1 Tax=Actinomadura chokoriensis TaxID=454156 RepID=UPI0031F8941B
MPVQVAELVSGQREWVDRGWFPPGPQLAICLSGGKNRLADLTDDELLQVAAAARRQTSWAQARELAAIAELTRRRTVEEESGDPDYRILSARESVTEEVSAALTVTGNAAATLVHLAEQLTGPLARTGDALEAGRVDLAKARVICDVTEQLPEHTARRVESAALEKASEQTTGQLRRRLNRIARRLAPEAVEERRREAVRQRRLELWDTPSGTSDLALCDLAAEDAHAIYNKITAAAHGIKGDGDTRPLSTIRADLATRLLQGLELPEAIRDLLAQAGDDVGSPVSGLSGLAESAAASELPGEFSADVGVAVLADEVNRRLQHVRARVEPRELPHAIRRTVQRIHAEFADAREVACQGDDEVHGRPGYRPSAALRREVEARHASCVFPSCNQPSHRCDLDHTVPWRPGITCRCNLAPLCRRHHRLKQRTDWRLFQIWAGLLVWVTPSGAWYIVRPDRQ